MKRIVGTFFLGLAAAMCFSTMAVAETSCPPAKLTESLPGATEVSLFDSGVSTARFPGQWQEGRFGEGKFRYRLFVDGSGIVTNDLSLRGWKVDFVCDLEAKTCLYATTSSPPEGAIKAAKAIGSCLTASPPAPKKPKEEPAAVVKAPKAAPSVPAAKAKVKETEKPEKPEKKPTVAAKKPVVPLADPKAKGTPAPAPVAKAVVPTSPKKVTEAVKKATETKTQPVTEAPAAKATTLLRPMPRPKALAGKVAALEASAKPGPGKVGGTQPLKFPDTDERTVVTLGPAWSWSGSKTLTVGAPATTYATGNTLSAKDSAFGFTAQPAVTSAVAKPAKAADRPVCWADFLPDDGKNKKVQRMLVLAGFDPGPVDGDPRERTKAALTAALGARAAEGPADAQVQKLRALLCRDNNRK